jgi:hypothetical protein
MTITNPTPIVIPPTPQQEFPHLWISDIVVHAPTVDNGFIHIETKPYNQDTKAIGDTAYRTIIRADDLWAAVNEVPEVAQAMFAIFQAVDPLRTWVNAKNAPQAPVEAPVEVPVEVVEQPVEEPVEEPI